MAVDPRIVSILIEELPQAIAWAKALFADAHPDQPVPTDEEVLASFQSAVASSIAKDDAWIAAHPD